MNGRLISGLPGGCYVGAPNISQSAPSAELVVVGDVVERNGIEVLIESACKFLAFCKIESMEQNSSPTEADQVRYCK